MEYFQEQEYWSGILGILFGILVIQTLNKWTQHDVDEKNYTSRTLF